MFCRKCGKELEDVYKSYEGDLIEDNKDPSMIAEFRCYDCDLEYIAVYDMVHLTCGGLAEDSGGGEIPLDFEEGKKLFA